MADLDALSTALRRQVPEPSERLLAAQKARLVADPRAVAPSPARRALPGVAGALAVAAVVAFVASFAARPGAVAVDARVPDPARATRARIPTELFAEPVSEKQELPDGSFVHLANGARGALVTERGRTSGARGARYRLEHGRAEFDIAPQPHAPFVVLAGPSEVRVLGTRFSVAFQPPEELEVAVEHGVVQVVSQGREVTLRAGERFDSAAAPAPAAPALAAASAKSRASWHELYAKGDYHGALAAARTVGLARLTSELGQNQLADLADAARLGGAPGEALGVLAALERRFPATAPGREARFLSGRVLLQSGDKSAAARAFEQYLERDPSGAYSTEAMGRLLELYAQRGDMARARSMAERYLARAPQGAYQRLARSLLTAR